MADISKELDNFKNAKYGKDVRGSMVSLAEKLNKESSDTVKTVSEYGDAEVSREQAEQDRQNAENARQQDFETMKSDSQAATIAANKAAERAEQAATGDISLKTVTFEVAAARAGIVSGDTLGVAFGKLAKYCTDIEDHAFNALVNNGLANIAGVSALDAVQANPDVADTLAYKIAQNLAAITSLNSNTGELGSTSITVYGNYCKATKKNGFVFVSGSSADKLLTASTYNDITTLPEGFRPKHNFYFTAGSMGGGIEIFGILYTSGILSLYPVTATKYWIYSFMFPC